jgi:ferritin-like protein
MRSDILAAERSGPGDGRAEVEEKAVMASEGLHEPQELVQQSTIDRHRAIVSIREEFEAVDWYDQRVDATDDADLAAVLAHNRDEEKEHAAMTLEWLRRNDPVLAKHMRTYLFTTEPVTEIEAEVESGGDPGPAAADVGPADQRSLGIGSLKGVD